MRLNCGLGEMTSSISPGADCDIFSTLELFDISNIRFSNQRRGVILESTDENNMSVVNAEVPLSEMFGFSTILRSSTQGKAEFTMEFLKYGQVPEAVASELKKKYQEERKAN